jgi:hypothetical protein
MLRTYKAILKDDNLKWVDEKPDNLSMINKSLVYVTILDEDIPGEIPDREKNTNTLVDFFKNSPLYGSQLDLERDNDFGREVEI